MVPKIALDRLLSGNPEFFGAVREASLGSTE